jgi:phage shock protein C
LKINQRKAKKKEGMKMGKKLFKSRTNRVICGVCGGIGEYFNVDPTIIRLLAVLLGCTTTGIIIYLVAAVIMPEEP